MNPEIKNQWVEALRSGEYEQGKGCLRSESNNHCCLGVLTDLAVKAGVGEWEYSPIQGWNFQAESGVLHPNVRKWAGLLESNPVVRGTSLANFNDMGSNFSQIADIIEENL